jgi:SPP1 gp7 family putative phage head morphogenesis protein
MNDMVLAAFDRFLEASNKPTARKAIAIDQAQARFERILARAFKRQKGLALKKLGWLKKFLVLQEAAAPQPWDNEAQSWWQQVGDVTDAIIETALVDAVSAGLDAGGAEMLRQAEIGLKFDLENPAAVAYIEQRGAELVSGLSETSISMMRTILANGIADGADYNAIAKEIGAAFDGFSRDRSKLIAVTEMGNAFEAGAEMAAQEMADAGATMEKSWLTANDSKVEPECLGNAAAGWIALADDFPSGDPHPLAHPNCRCTALYRVASAARRAA